jgi:hemoglobin/transferrin/lactoferrin receptor protein
MSLNITYKFFLLVFSLFLGVVQAQEIQVLDQESGQPIFNVAVFNADKSKATVTDFDGKCDISAFERQERITFKHLGYITYKVTKNHLRKIGSKALLAPNAQQLEEVVMSVSRWEQQKKDVPQKITTVSAAAVSFTNPQTSADLLQSTGQVFVQKSQLGGGSPMIRGFATNRLLIAVDGVRMNNAIFRGGNLQNVISIDPFSIKNTEVVFGPGSVIYGSDAIGGVMNFYTKGPEVSSLDSLKVKGATGYRFASANREHTGHGEISLSKGKWGSFTSVSYSDFDDLTMGTRGPDSYLREQYAARVNGEDVLLVNDNPEKQLPTGYDQLNLMQKIAFHPSKRWQFDIGAYYSETSDYARYDRLIRPNTTGDGLRNAEWYYGPQQWFMGNLQAYNKARGRFYDAFKLTAAYQNFQESRHSRRFGNDERHNNFENVDALSINLDFENKRMKNFRWYYGGEFLYNKISSNGNAENIETGATQGIASRYPDGSRWESSALYFNSEYKAQPNLSLLGGLRYSHVWINTRFDTTYYPFPFTEEKLSTGALTGSLGLSWFPRADLQFTLNGATGFRAPNIDDMGKVFDSEPGAVVVPNPALKPEYAYNVEFGVRKNFGDVLTLRGAAYYTYLVDALVRRDYTFNGEEEIWYDGELSQVQAIQNAANAFVYGFEFGLDAYLNENLTLKGNLTLTEGEEKDEDGTHVPARHVAPTFGDFHVIWRNQRLKADLFVNYNGEIPFDDLAPSERSKAYIYAQDVNGNPYSPSWTTLNLRSQWLFANHLKVSATLENITNERYRTYSSGIVAPGANLILGVDYVF